MKVRIGGVPEHFNLPWHQAIEENAFEPFELAAEFITFHGGTGAMTQALEADEIDLAIVLTEGCVANQLNGSSLRIVKTFIQSPLIWGIHVAENSSIQAATEIRGQRYAISRMGSGSHLMAIVDAAERDWPTSDLRFVIVQNLDGARTALANGEADIFFWEKFTTDPYVQSGEFRRVGTRETLWPAFVVCGKDHFLRTNAGQIRLLLETMNGYCRALMHNPYAVSIIADRYSLPARQVAEWFALTDWNTDFKCPLSSIETARRYLERLDLVPITDFPTEQLWLNL